MIQLITIEKDLNELIYTQASDEVDNHKEKGTDKKKCINVYIFFLLVI